MSCPTLHTSLGRPGRDRDMPPACFASPACGTLNGRLRSLGASRCVAGSGRRVARSGDPRRGRPRTAVPLTAQFSGDEGVTDDDAGVSDDWLEKALSEMPAAPRPSFVEEDQFTEFERRDRAALQREKEGLACVDLVDAHRYVMIADESQTTFERAARRHGGLLVQSGAECGRRFVIAKGVRPRRPPPSVSPVSRASLRTGRPLTRYPFLALTLHLRRLPTPRSATTGAWRRTRRATAALRAL
jgi:hypothetical protein